VEESLAGDGDGEIGPRLTAGIMALREENLVVLTVKGASVGDATLQRAPDAIGRTSRPSSSCRRAKIVTAMTPGISSLSSTRSQISVSGSARVLQLRGCFVCEGERGSL
jgi:hypothetical protein